MRAITWIKERGAEFAEIDLTGAGLRAVTPSRQLYTYLRHGTADELGLAPADGADRSISVIRYQSGDFSADVAFDAQGLVVNYPGIGRLA
jgi:hypothetical protein